MHIEREWLMWYILFIWSISFFFTSYFPFISFRKICPTVLFHSKILRTRMNSICKWSDLSVDLIFCSSFSSSSSSLRQDQSSLECRIEHIPFYSWIESNLILLRNNLVRRGLNEQEIIDKEQTITDSLKVKKPTFSLKIACSLVFRHV